MPRRRVGRPRKRRYGGNVLGSVNKFLKKYKVISRVGKLAGLAGLPGASIVSGAADLAGYGRRRRYRRRR